MKRCLVFSFSICIYVGAIGQSSQAQIEAQYNLLRNAFEANNAYNTVEFVEKRWRLAGNTGFNESIYYVENILKQAGYKKEISGESDGPLTYRIETRKMNRPTWEPISASLTLAGETEPLLEFTSNRNMLAINSGSTAPEGVTAEIVYVGKGDRKEFESNNVKGKIVFAESSISSLNALAIQYGAIGALAYAMPSYTQPEKNINSIQFQSISSNSSFNNWGILLSFAAKDKLKASLQKGGVMVTVKTKTNIFKAEELTIVANARGTSLANERFVFSAHVQEPGANDNATGVGTLAEMARVTAELIQQQKFSPQRTITFLWGDEIVSTKRYITEDANRAKGIKWGLSLDMVGEDVTKTGGSFLIEKMPDPSAIWTRGKDKHTDWGGSVLKESQMFPHYFNDFLLNRCRQQGKDNGWVVNANPFEGGSDHTPFLEAKIPGLLMWHFTDVFYHTDADRLNMVSEEEMKNVGVSALASAMILSSADESMTLYLVEEIKDNAIERLKVEYALSKDAIEKGSSFKTEEHILLVWTSWYEKAIERMSEINTNGNAVVVKNKISEAKMNVTEESKKLVQLMKR